jgi:hypothetical protein
MISGAPGPGLVGELFEAFGKRPLPPLRSPKEMVLFYPGISSDLMEAIQASSENARNTITQYYLRHPSALKIMLGLEPDSQRLVAMALTIVTFVEIPQDLLPRILRRTEDGRDTNNGNRNVLGGMI